jgi:hypothetical protein
MLSVFTLTICFCCTDVQNWQIESPFRVMDEYDVFLDEAMRRKTLDLLVSYSKSLIMANRQFIILTPNSLSSINTDPKYVRIHRMPEPERRRSHGLQQQTLEFSAAAATDN